MHKKNLNVKTFIYRYVYMYDVYKINIMFHHTFVFEISVDILWKNNKNEKRNFIFMII